VEIAAQVVDLERSNGDRDFEFVLAKSRLGRKHEMKDVHRLIQTATRLGA